MKPAAIAWEIAPGESRFLSLDKPEPDVALKTFCRLAAWNIAAISQWVLREGTP